MLIERQGQVNPKRKTTGRRRNSRDNRIFKPHIGSSGESSGLLQSFRARQQLRPEPTTGLIVNTLGRGRAAGCCKSWVWKELSSEARPGKQRDADRSFAPQAIELSPQSYGTHSGARAAAEQVSREG